MRYEVRWPKEPTLKIEAIDGVISISDMDGYGDDICFNQAMLGQVIIALEKIRKELIKE